MINKDTEIHLDRLKQSAIFRSIFNDGLDMERIFIDGSNVYIKPLAEELNPHTLFKNIRNLIDFYDRLESKELWLIMDVTLKLYFKNNYNELKDNAIMVSFFQSKDSKSPLVYRPEYDTVDDYFSNEPNTIQASFPKLIKHINERTDLYPEYLTDEQKIWSIYFKQHPLVPSHFSAIDLATSSENRTLLSMIDA